MSLAWPVLSHPGDQATGVPRCIARRKKIGQALCGRWLEFARSGVLYPWHFQPAIDLSVLAQREGLTRELAMPLSDIGVTRGA